MPVANEDQRHRWGAPQPLASGRPGSFTVRPAKKRNKGAIVAAVAALAFAGAVTVYVVTRGEDVQVAGTSVTAVGTSTSVASVTVPDPDAGCRASFVAALAAGTDAAKFATLAACSEEQWVGLQAATPIDGVTLAGLCDGRGGLPATACVTPDAERAARQVPITGRPTPQAPSSVAPRVTAKLRSIPPTSRAPSTAPAASPATGPPTTAPEKHRISGDVTDASRASAANGKATTCGPPQEIGPYQVVINNAAGTTLATLRLPKWGQVRDPMAPFCHFEFSGIVPLSDFYVVRVDNESSVTISQSQLRDNNWRMALFIRLDE